MSNLVNQPTAMPTRKLWAVIISGLIVSAIRVSLAEFLPDQDFEPILLEVGPWVQTGIMALAGYFTRNKE